MHGRGRRLDAADPARGASLLPLLVVAGVLAWWAMGERRLLRRRLLPGGDRRCFGMLAALLLFAPWPATLRGARAVALVALLGLAAWTAASPRVVARARTWRSRTPCACFIYAVAFALGLWICLLLGRADAAGAGPDRGRGGAGGARHPDRALDRRQRRRVPRGGCDPSAIRSGTAMRSPAFFLIGDLADGDAGGDRANVDWRSARRPDRARGALHRARRAGAEPQRRVRDRRGSRWSLLAAHSERPADAGLPGTGGGPSRRWRCPGCSTSTRPAAGTPRLRSIPCAALCRAMAVSALLAASAGLRRGEARPRVHLSRRCRTRHRLGPRRRRRGHRARRRGRGAELRGRPRGFLDRQTEELSAGSPDLSEQGSRFGLDLRTERGDFWRVALDDLADSPWWGRGRADSGSATCSTARSTLQPEDPHSVVMLMASELGLPGLLLFGAFLVAAIVRCPALAPAGAFGGRPGGRGARGRRLLAGARLGRVVLVLSLADAADGVRLGRRRGPRCCCGRPREPRRARARAAGCSAPSRGGHALARSTERALHRTTPCATGGRTSPAPTHDLAGRRT